MKPKVTIAVPIYNVENYLRKCLDCLVSQTLQDIEIILVDDGSPDNCGTICDEYACLDSRIKVIHKENGGLWTARQIALDNASGDFFCTCDSDDWPELTMYEVLYQKAIETDADVVVADYFSNYEDGRQVEHRIKNKLKDRKEIFSAAVNGCYPCMVWHKLFRTDFLIRNHISWEPNINQGEDFVLFMKILQHPVKIEYVSQCLYHYRRRYGETSYTNNITLVTYQQLCYIRDWLKKNYDMDAHPKAMFHLWVGLAFSGLRVKDGMTTSYYRKTSLDNIHFYDFLRYKHFSLKDLLIFFTKIFGYKSGRYILEKLYNHVYK